MLTDPLSAGTPQTETRRAEARDAGGNRYTLVAERPVNRFGPFAACSDVQWRVRVADGRAADPTSEGGAFVIQPQRIRVTVARRGWPHSEED